MPQDELSNWDEVSLRECEASAIFWRDALSAFAHEQRQKADAIVYLAAGLSTLSGLGVWATLSALKDWWAVAIISIVALASSMVTVVSKQKDYAARSAAATSLPVRYADSATALRSARKAVARRDQDAAQLAATATVQFHKIKADKDLLDAAELQRKREREMPELLKRTELSATSSTGG